MKKESDSRIRPAINFFFTLPKFGTGGMMVVIGVVIVIFLVAMTILSPFITPHSPIQLSVGPADAAPSLSFPMGTNRLGQDIFSRMVAGGSTMMEVAGLAVAICFLIGVPLGLLAGYSRRLIDGPLSLLMDSLYAFPGLVLAIAIAAVLGRGVVNLAIAIAVVYIPTYFRVVRSQVLTMKEMPFVEAVKVEGGGTLNILFRQIFPNVLASVAVIASINVADAVITEAGLTYIGLGVNAALPDWGFDIYYGYQSLLAGAWWTVLFPGLMVVLLAGGFTFIGEGLSEVLNPRLRR
ncbi:MAG TPA: ABC transporter permease [Candidatus Acidoferrales bacterium]|nr:ABC transporter permease [Candidatus Acidoferrales bacterium]